MYLLLGLGIAVIVIAVMKKKTEDMPSTEVEQLLHQFIEEMETENERLMAKIASQTDHMVHELSSRDRKIDLLSEHVHLLQQQLEQVKSSIASAGKEIGSPSIVNRYGELFSLLEQGLTIDEAAKKTGMGKGEIQLIIGLAKGEKDT